MAAVAGAGSKGSRLRSAQAWKLLLTAIAPNEHTNAEDEFAAQQLHLSLSDEFTTCESATWGGDAAGNSPRFAQ